MSVRKPLVLVGGQLAELPAGDGIAGAVPVVVTLVDAEPVSVDISAGDVFDLTLSGNRTLNFTGGSAQLDGKKFLLRIKQGVGSSTVSWGTGAHFGSDFTSITLTAAVDKVDVVGVAYRHTSATYDILGYSRGY